MEKRKLFSLYDLIIIFVVVIITILSIILVFRKNDNLIAVVRSNGEVIDQYQLSTITNDIRVDYGTQYMVTVIFSNNSVKVIDAECPDKLCVKTGKITKSGQSIVCLPAKITISLVGKSNDIDGVVG